MRLHVHPDYLALKAEISNIPGGGYETQEVYRNIRNTVSRITIGGKTFVLKKYKVPNAINQVAYSFFRKSKARRSFEYAERLLKLGIETAKPVAYIEEIEGGLFRTSYFLSECLEYPTIGTVDFLYKPENSQITADFIDFTAMMHAKKVFHKDYNASNIFYYLNANGKYSFALVDINRMSFGKGTLWSCMEAFNRLDIDLENMYGMISPYASARKLNIESCLTVFLLHRKYFAFRNNSKNFLKKHSKKR